MKNILSVLVTLAVATPALAHGDGTIHAHNQDYAAWAIVLGLAVYLTIHLVRNRNR